MALAALMLQAAVVLMLGVVPAEVLVELIVLAVVSVKAIGGVVFLSGY